MEDRDLSLEDELASGQWMWRVITTALGMPEAANDTRDYWQSVADGTRLLLGIAYKLAHELGEHHSDCDRLMPASTRALIGQILDQREEIEAAWLDLLK
ncbi:hypothetical protein RB608_18145 [Nocardioides sp. LHD-245]|uniref:hypothetical protein n=1 Tax=Nocardioides sp. LHD-245 TaxID=3051387 RepID=UPI0027DEE3D4|nr:hypothetical protein [Nocardioides sp. LHD-245]